MEGDDSDFANFALPVLKASLEARSQNVSGNKEQLAAHAIGCPKTHFFFLSLSLSTKSRSSGQPKTTQRHFFPTLHLLSAEFFATAKVVAFVLFRNSVFNFRCYTQHEATPSQKSARK